MARFETEREAKEYLAGRIVDEASREGVPLNEVERKMLYFTETGWTLPNMLEVNAEFEQAYDEDEYERKIADLVRRIEERNETEGESEQGPWDEAVEKLSEGDHYLLVLINPKLASSGVTQRPTGDFRRLILTALACSFGLILLMALLAHFFPNLVS
jgi:hypothetical protein